MKEEENYYRNEYFENMIGSRVRCRFVNASAGDIVQDRATGERFILVDQDPTWDGWSKVKLSGKFWRVWAYKLRPVE